MLWRMPSFSAEILQVLHEADEIDIETARRDGTPRRTTIWIVVVDDQVFVRSVRGTDGAWYKAVQRNAAMRVYANAETIDTRAVAASDPASVEKVSQAISEKYQSRWPGPTASMLRPETLSTTLRLDPA
jgi:hypothetical protein